MSVESREYLLWRGVQWHVMCSVTLQLLTLLSNCRERLFDSSRYEERSFVHANSSRFARSGVKVSRILLSRV
jgi:hypothetical protein